jgi:hypothetical protein
VVGNGVVVHLRGLLAELKTLREAEIDYKGEFCSSRIFSHMLCLPSLYKYVYKNASIMTLHLFCFDIIPSCNTDMIEIHIH